MTRDEAIIVIKDAFRSASLSNSFNKKLCVKFDEALSMAIECLENSLTYHCTNCGASGIGFKAKEGKDD